MSLEFTKSSHLLFRIFLFSKGGNPKKTNARKETCLHCVCMETNAQSVHVDKRRADCLSYLLKWRGATLAEGQLEKVDLAAQDEVRFELFLNFHSLFVSVCFMSSCVENNFCQSVCVLVYNPALLHLWWASVLNEWK